jgi:hypothetical protein
MSRHQPTDVISVCYVYFAKLFWVLEHLLMNLSFPASIWLMLEGVMAEKLLLQISLVRWARWHPQRKLLVFMKTLTPNIHHQITQSMKWEHLLMIASCFQPLPASQRVVDCPPGKLLGLLPKRNETLSI